jgi:hypothetical protein
MRPRLGLALAFALATWALGWGWPPKAGRP